MKNKEAWGMAWFGYICTILIIAGLLYFINHPGDGKTIVVLDKDNNELSRSYFGEDCSLVVFSLKEYYDNQDVKAYCVDDLEKQMENIDYGQ